MDYGSGPVKVPRLVSHYGTGPVYSYSRQIQELPNRPFTPQIEWFMERASKAVSLPKHSINFNSALLNLYRDGRDSIGWHSDDETQIASGSPVVSVSLGIGRTFMFREKRTGKEFKMCLEHGDLLIMHPLCQAFFQHSIPKEPWIAKPRVSLTFRVLQNQEPTQPKPKVLNARGNIPSNNAVYVGRPSLFGNPFKIGKDGDRETVIAMYKEYLLKNPELMESLPSLRGKDLICWCAPYPCHADILLELANR